MNMLVFAVTKRNVHCKQIYNKYKKAQYALNIYLPAIPAFQSLEQRSISDAQLFFLKKGAHIQSRSPNNESQNRAVCVHFAHCEQLQSHCGQSANHRQSVWSGKTSVISPTEVAEKSWASFWPPVDSQKWFAANLATEAHNRTPSTSPRPLCKP